MPGELDWYVDIVLPFPLRQAFTYSLPAELHADASFGKRAIVQFGPRKIYTGIIVAIHQNKPDAFEVKEVIDILDTEAVVYELQITFWQWIADYYCSSLGEVMNAALPSSLKLESESKVIINPSFDGDISDLSPEESWIVDALGLKNELPVSDIQKILKKTHVFKTIKSLYQKGVILPLEELKDTYKPKTENIIRLHPGIDSVKILKTVFDELERAPRQLELFLNFRIMEKKYSEVRQTILLKESGINKSVLDALVKKNYLVCEKKVVGRLDHYEADAPDFELTPAQQACLLSIREQWKEKTTVLLHGITSSGKTHIYIKLIEDVIASGKQVLYLVPEISLSAQLIGRLRGYFGEKVGIYHSRFNPNERYEIWQKTMNSEYKVILGVRSALFLPFKNLGLVIVDEEHEVTYKQQSPAPYYHARDAAVYYAALANAKCLLGSATPAIESYYNAQQGKYGYYALNERYSQVTPPQFVVNDLKKDRKRNEMRGNMSFALYTDLKKIITKGDQAILFQNRRGYAPYMECEICDYIPSCNNCDIKLTYHRYLKKLVCHYCGYKIPVPALCPKCKNIKIKVKGFGTEKIEDDLDTFFPDLKHLRLDLDTSRKKNAFADIISKFEKGEHQVLVGTQMVTKGLDFEKVKLVGILNADQLLNFPDFRSTERTFNLISQVGGRAGRRDEQGKVIIQTNNPEHPVFQFIIHHDYDGFYQSEMELRSKFKYPPLSKVIILTLRHKDLKTVRNGANQLTGRLRYYFGNRVLGPEAPPVSKLKNQYLMQIMIKFERGYKQLQQAKEFILTETGKLKLDGAYKSIRVQIDVDPV